MYEISLQPQPSSDLLMAFTPWLHATLPDQIWDWPHLVYCRKRLARLTTGEIDRLAFALPPQHGKPVYERSLVLTGSGSRVPLADIKVGDRVITHRGRPRPVTAVHVQGELPCVRITTVSGRVTHAALDHPFLTSDGTYVDAGLLTPAHVLCAVIPSALDAGHVHDPVESVVPCGSLPCRCLTVAEDATFTADDLIVHNTKSLVCPYIAWRMLREPGLRVGVGSHTQSYANKIGRAISRIIALAGGEMGEVRQAADWHLTNGSTFIAKGVGSALAGESIDLFAMDDVFGSRETADSVAHQERVYEWYMDDVVPRLQQDAGLLFVNCLPADTLITLANSPPRPIHAIRPGDRVVSHAPSGPVVQTVTAFVPQPAADLYEVVTPTARVRATSRHPFLVASESGPVYRPVSALRAGDRLHQLTDAGFATTPILGIYPAGREPVYDLTVSGSENFIADGLVSHNTRWSPGDLIGRLQQAEEWSMWEYHRLPAIAEEGDPLGRAVGEALCPERYPIEKLLQRRRIEGLGFESLYQGHPVPRGGTFFRREWFRLVPSAPHCRMIRWWDLASSRKDDACYTSGVLMGHEPNTDNYFVIDVVRGRWSPADRNEIMLQTAVADAQQRGFERTYFESPPYDRDHAAERAIIAKLAGYAVRPDPVTGSKEMRAEPVAGAAKSGLISLVQASWNSAFLGEIEAFPRGQYLDQVDSLSGCYNRLTRSENKYIMAVV